jgi:hypothetical protein
VNVTAGTSSGVPCSALDDAILATSGNITLNAGAVVDSYSSSAGSYGGSNVGSAGNIAASGSILNNGGTFKGQETQSASIQAPALAAPTNATNLPLGASSPGTLNINTASSSLTLAPATYVIASLNINSPGALTISPAGPVTIYVTGTLNLGGNENAGGIPSNLTFVVTSSGTVNINSNGLLVGGVYAPSSPINLNSVVDGFLVGSSVTLNSNAAVHYDTSLACPSTPPTAIPPHNLPAPPSMVGCYVGTWNGWALVPCTAFSNLPVAMQAKPYIGGGQVTIPGYLSSGEFNFGPMPGIASTTDGFKYGQVETTFVSVNTGDPSTGDHTEMDEPETMSTQTPCQDNSSTNIDSISVQANTNNFPATGGAPSQQSPPDDAWVQFALQSYGPGNTFSSGFVVCIYQNDWTLGKGNEACIPDTATDTACSQDSDCADGYKCNTQPGNGCKMGFCQVPTYYTDCLSTGNSSLGDYFPLQNREFQAFDFASVAGSTYTDGVNPNQTDLGLVVALSWFANSTLVANDYRGLYAVVAKDRYGLGQTPGGTPNWTSISGTVLGYGSCSTATFPQDTMVYTSIQAGNCAVATTPFSSAYPADLSWPGLCQNSLQIAPNAGPQYSTHNYTDESNNLNIITNIPNVAYPPTLGYSTAGDNFLEVHYLASVGGSCPASASRVYVKDNPQDYGSTPSNLGGEPFWESPDIIVVPHNQAVTKDTAPSDPHVTAGQTYDVWVRVHNDFSCSQATGVTAQVWWGDPVAGSPNWQQVAFEGSGPVTVDPEGHNIVGPFTWTVPNTSNISPHECLMADIQANGETYPSNLFDAPDQYQTAQRNLEIGGTCSWTLTNANTSAAQLSVSLKTQVAASPNASQLYTVGTNDLIQVVFDDPNKTLYNAWEQNTSQPPENCSVTWASNTGSTGQPGTTIRMNAGGSYSAVWGATLVAGASTVLTATVEPALFSGTTVDLAIGTYLNGPNGQLVLNGGTCSFTTSATEGTGTAVQ